MVEIKKLKKIRLTNFTNAIGINSKELFILNGFLVSLDQISDLNNFFTIDLKNCVISPGFIDPQINGYETCNFWSSPPPSFLEIENLRLKLALHGVVAFCPTIITAPKDNILNFVNHINSYLKSNSSNPGANILGIHIEGIFITKYGVHDPKYVENDLTVDKIKEYVKDNVLIFTLAPEVDKTGNAIGFLQKNNIVVSIGHSNANCSEGELLINKYNLKTVTHMFNSLRSVNGFSHRGKGISNLAALKLKLENSENIDPMNDGIILPILKNKDVLCMVICDGVHVNKEVLDFLIKVKGNSNISLTSDLVSKDFHDEAKSVGNLGGGQITLDKCVLNLIDWKICDLEDSLLLASRPISNMLGITNKGYGQITFGKEANITFWDTTINGVKGTIIGENVFLNY